MEDFEQQLKKALARKDAPEWFEARVLAAARRTEGRVRRPMFLWRWVSAAALGVLVMSGVTWQYERVAHEREEGEAAKARLVLALRITSDKLRKIEQKLNDVERNN